MSGNNYFGGFDSYDAFMCYYDNPAHGHCIEFTYKGRFYQIVRDYKGNVCSEENKQTTVYWLSDYPSGDNIDKVFTKAFKRYSGHDLRTVFADYRLFDGMLLKDSLIKGYFVFT